MCMRTCVHVCGTCVHMCEEGLCTLIICVSGEDIV